MAMSIDDKLGLLRFNADKSYKHITVNEDYADDKEVDRVIMACPAKLYSRSNEGKVLFNHEGCLECGTCRVLSGGKVIATWNHPNGGMGVNFRQG